MPAQYLVTGRLANVIQLITLGRQTGILRVYRGQGGAREAGQIQFVEGQPAAGLLGELIGNAAIRVLSNWGECYYAFEDIYFESDATTATEDDPWGTPYGAPPMGESPWGSRPGSPSPGGSSSGSWPGYGNATPSTYPNGPNGGSSGALTNGALGSTNGYSSASHPGVQQRSAPIARLPRRTVRAELTETLPLDRRERMILLLVDGRRSISDLSRLTRRNEDEVHAVLINLRMLGLVE
ncbi:MAG TPA: hypothetical protein VGR57_05255 [Ktedonobacterales bacterium]|nr:hypothetical protein [Ktedonobacterales bacterium]